MQGDHLPPIDAEFTVLDATRPMDDPHSDGRDLLPTIPADQRSAHSCRPQASFVAQLLAAADQAPQVRSLRRGSPEDALASYRGGGQRRGLFAAAGTRTSLTV
jgi:hypothetical protein